MSNLGRMSRSDSHELEGSRNGNEVQHVGQRARRRVGYRLLPFVFLLYVINYTDRVNISFANLRTSADLGFGGRVYGLGVGVARTKRALKTGRDALARRRPPRIIPKAC